MYQLWISFVQIGFKSLQITSYFLHVLVLQYCSGDSIIDEISLDCEGCTNPEQIIGDPNNLILSVFSSVP